MKKLVAVVLLLMLLASFAGCELDGAKKQVTIYIPKTMTISAPGENMSVELEVVFEEGWQSKNSFTVSYRGDFPGLEGVMPSMQYGDRYTVTETPKSFTTEVHYDAQGRIVKQVTKYMQNPTMEKAETVVTYDANGRRASETVCTYAVGSSTGEEQTRTYTYTDTPEGSQCRVEEGAIATVYIYDKNYRMISQATLINGEETSRTENSYDAAGNLTATTQYVQGQALTQMEYTYRTVAVNGETAARLPQFNKAN